MRQTTHLYVATVAAALVMSCALPYATRANLDPNGFYEARAPRISSEMAAEAPVEFVTFPRAMISSKPDRQSIDLSMFTPQGFVELSKNLKKEIVWPSVSAPVAAKPAPAAKARVNLSALHILPQQTDASQRIAFTKPVLAPVAFVRFCARYPDDCKTSAIDLAHAPVELTKERWTELTKVNRDVNHTIRPQANPDGAMGEQWLVAPRHGDCNDYAVTKRHDLLARGWPAHALLLTEVVIASGEHHLVVIVRTSEDDFVLDNLSADVRPVSQIDYEWVRAQRAENPKFWATINVARADRVAMNVR